MTIKYTERLELHSSHVCNARERLYSAKMMVYAR